MVRYCSCSRGIDYSYRTAVLRDARGVEICSHCGGVIPSAGSQNGDDTFVFESQIFYRKALECSINGDHLSAIGFYEDAFNSSKMIEGDKSRFLCYIADEYEAMGDYALAEDYLDRSCDVAGPPPSIVCDNIVKKGDFLFRRERYDDAIDTYERALNELKFLDDIYINLDMLKCYVRIVHFSIASYKRLGKYSNEERYHYELKRGIKRFIQSRGLKDKGNADYISTTSWQIYNDEGMTDEALILIDDAIKLHPDDKHFTRKAIFIKSKLKMNVLLKRVKHNDLKLINEALKILPDDCDNGPYLTVKADILDQLGEPVKAKVCRALSVKNYDEVDEADRQLKKLKSGETYINITGTQFYQNFKPFGEGTIVDLIREPDNKHDKNAIRVEIKGKTVGYVANSKYTLINEVKSASDIKDTKSKRAQVQFILFKEWVIAKLI